MAAKKAGNLIKEARTEAGLTQEQLARKIAGSPRRTSAWRSGASWI